ncbi:AraC family transcriptional regulator N-terminal domain-containing protein [Priestia aryabhattai]|uniref:AraC family transcriptional regulator n=1 Tax=Priestia TaxID=2800373 RepID=UPI0020794FD8|nr:AraC family transcriptional regulator [Priestia megaterium]USL39631.1 AraC family transcriptional regulator [Priestia megaterium]
MSKQITKQQNDLAEFLELYTGQDGFYDTAIPFLRIARQSNITEPDYSVYKPSLFIVVQGVKEVTLAQEQFRYGPAHYLVASVGLPASARVIEASSEMPYLSLRIEFTASQILEVLNDSEIQVDPTEKTKRAIYVSQIESSLLDAVIRLVHLLDNPKDIPVLSPLFVKEILYRVLQGPHGTILKQTAIEGSHTHRIKEVIEYITNNYHEAFKVQELAEIANMSVASLYRHFKEVTALSPLQFQKQLRLQQAQHLLLSESTDATDVAFRVGYESPSQFSREYSRLFGLPPREDIRRMREKSDHRAHL